MNLSTTLRMIAGLELPTSGEIYLDGEEISQKPPSERDIAFVFQMFALYPHMNVGKNMSYPLLSQGMSRAKARAKVLEVARILGVTESTVRNHLLQARRDLRDERVSSFYS